MSQLDKGAIQHLDSNSHRLDKGAVEFYSGADVTPPTVVSVTIATNGISLTIVFDEAVTGDGTGFELDDATALTYSAGSGTDTLTFTIARTVQFGETPTLSYSSAVGNIADSALNELVTFSLQEITNNSTADATAPTLVSATINTAGNVLTLNFSENVIGTDSDGLVITGEEGSILATYSSGSGTTSLVFSLSRTVYDDEIVTLDYTPGNIEDASGNALASIADFAITNNSTTPLPIFTYQHIKNGVDISGATSAVLTIDPTDINDSGTYTIRITSTVTGQSRVITLPQPVVVT